MYFASPAAESGVLLSAMAQASHSLGLPNARYDMIIRENVHRIYNTVIRKHRGTKMNEEREVRGFANC
jgi:hypothetical protein